MLDILFKLLNPYPFSAPKCLCFSHMTLNYYYNKTVLKIYKKNGAYNVFVESLG